MWRAALGLSLFDGIEVFFTIAELPRNRSCGTAFSRVILWRSPTQEHGKWAKKQQCGQEVRIPTNSSTNAYQAYL